MLPKGRLTSHSLDNHFAFLHFFFLGMVLVTTSCTVLQTSIHSSSGILSTRFNALNWLVTCYFQCVIINDFISVIPEWSNVFPYFLQFMLEFCNKELMIWVTASSRSCFCWLYRASPSSATKIIINLISVLTILWCPCVESFLMLLEESVCYDQYVLLAKLC